MRDEIRAVLNLELSIIGSPKEQMRTPKCRQQSGTSADISCAGFVLQNNAKLTDALGLESFDLLPNFRSEGCRDGSGVDLGSAHGCAGFWLVTVSRRLNYLFECG